MIVVLPTMGLIAQSSSDSLLQVLKTTKPEDRILLFRKAVTSVLQKNPERAVTIAKDVMDASASFDSTFILTTQRVHAHVLMKIGRYNDAYKSLTQILPIARRLELDNELVIILNLLSIIEMRRGEYGKSLDYLFSILPRLSGESIVQTSAIYHNIGFAYYKVHDLDKAILYYKKAIEFEERDGSNVSLSSANLGLCYVLKGNIKVARGYIDKGLAHAKDDQNYTVALHAKGMAEFHDGNYLESEGFLNRALKLAKKNNDSLFVAESQSYLARIFIRNKKFDDALLALAGCEKIAIERNFTDLLVDIYTYYMSYADRSEDLKMKAFYIQKYLELKQIVYRRDLIQHMAINELQLKAQENDRAIQHSSSVIDSRNRLIEIQHIIQSAWYTFFALIIILLAIFYAMNRQKRAIAIELERRIKVRANSLDQFLNRSRFVKFRLEELCAQSLLEINERMRNVVVGEVSSHRYSVQLTIQMKLISQSINQMFPQTANNAKEN